MSSIFDALKKLEDEKSARERPGKGNTLLRTPPPGRGRRGLFPWLIVLLVVAAGGAVYLSGRESEAPDSDVPAPVAGSEADKAAQAARDPLPAAAPAPAASPGTPAALPPAPVLSEEQQRAREKLLARVAEFRRQSAAVKAGEGESAAPAPPREPARLARVYPETPPAPEAPPAAPPAVEKPPVPPAPPAVVAALPPERAVPEVPARPASPAPAPEKAAPPAPVVKRKVPMMMVTEVTYHRQPEFRTARIRIEGDKPHLVREGDHYRGLAVKEITSGAITVDVAGTEVSVDVGESLSFTVNEPDFH